MSSSRTTRRLLKLARLRRLRRLPWPLVFEAGMVVRGRWRSLAPRDRERLATLLRQSRGWPGNLSSKERAEARALVAKVDLRRLAGDLALVARKRWRGGSERRGRGRRR